MRRRVNGMNKQALEIKVMCNFIFSKIGDMISNDYGEPEYFQEGNMVFEDLFGFEKFIDKTGECAGYKELYVLLQKIGFEQVFNLCNAPKMMGAMRDMILIRARLIEIKKEIRKCHRKGKRSRIDGLRKEEKYLVKMYREAAKIFAKRAGIKNVAKNRYKNRYRNVNSLLNESNGRDSWSLYGDYDDDDEFEDEFDSLDHSEFARYAAKRGLRFPELEKELGGRRGYGRAYDQYQDDDDEFYGLKDRYQDEIDDLDDYEGYGPTTESERMRQDMMKLQNQMVSIAEAVTRLQNFGPSTDTRPNFNRPLKDNLTAPPSRGNDGVSDVLIHTLNNLNMGLGQINNTMEALTIGQTVMMTPDQRQKYKMASSMISGQETSEYDDPFDDDDDDDETLSGRKFSDPRPAPSNNSWGMTPVIDDEPVAPDPLRQIMHQNAGAPVQRNRYGGVKVRRSMDQFMEQHIDGQIHQGRSVRSEAEYYGGIDPFDEADRTRGANFKPCLSVDQLMKGMDPDVPEEEREKLLEAIPDVDPSIAEDNVPT